MPSSSPVHVVCAIILDQGVILLAQRPPGKRLAGFWEFPGGKIEAGEQPEDALHREIAEELGCSLSGLQSGPPVLHAYEWGTICLHPFIARIAENSGPPVAHEHSDLKWVTLQNLYHYDLAPADIPVVEWLQVLLPQG